MAVDALEGTVKNYLTPLEFAVLIPAPNLKLREVAFGKKYPVITNSDAEFLLTKQRMLLFRYFRNRWSKSPMVLFHDTTVTYCINTGPPFNLVRYTQDAALNFTLHPERAYEILIRFNGADYHPPKALLEEMPRGEYNLIRAVFNEFNQTKPGLKKV
ncbi:hypothetical protein HY385_00565 [Candidatus Daviesbacteria bacterium]|nr:hypothetical protein [Candidatus Daviesbacteria bacterium]